MTMTPFLLWLDKRIEAENVWKLVDAVDKSHFMYKYHDQSYKAIHQCHELIDAFKACLDFGEVEDPEFGLVKFGLTQGWRRTPPRKMAFREMLDKARDTKFSMSMNDNWLNETILFFASASFIMSMSDLLLKWKRGEVLSTVEQWAITEMYGGRR